MPFVQAKCTNCGAYLEVDNTKDAAVCQFCGTPFIVEKAINNYNITNNISAGVVNIYGSNSADFVIRAGTLEKYTGASSDVVIPDGVTSIGQNAFQSCSGLKSVVIPISVTKISNGAFRHCSSLTCVVIPTSVKDIDGGAFEWCDSLTSIELSEGITTIGTNAFSGCSKLTTITIPSSVKYIGEYAFSSCNSLEDVHILGNPIAKHKYEDEDGCVFNKLISNRIFSDCSRLKNVYASTEWKRENWESAKCLEYYKPAPPMATHKSTDSSACYIATAVYGSYDCPQVWTLRRFRDDKLSTTWHGRAFIRLYYATSPTLVRWFGDKEWFQKLWRPRLDNLVSRLQTEGVSDAPYDDKQW